MPVKVNASNLSALRAGSEESMRELLGYKVERNPAEHTDPLSL